jgi:thiamine-monophosphate kinase
MGEFQLIERFFKPKPASAGVESSTSAIHSVVLGIGDDCALLQPTPGQQLAVSSDMLLEGRHFFADVDPAALGHKALAVNLSDLAAMGAEPLGFTLALALPPQRAADEAWLAAFAGGLRALADASACPLVGGDTTAGPLNLCITVFGQVPPGQALRRDGAQPGDELWVSGHLGDARLALEALQGRLTLPPDALPALLAATRQRLERPTPRLALGRALRGIANSCIDLSDGLVGDLGHVLKASRVGAVVEVDIASNLIAYSALSTPTDARIDPETRRRAVLAGGDDYELLFSAPPAARAAVQAAGHATGTPVTRIGHLNAQPGLRLRDAQGQPLATHYRAFDHFDK